MAPCGCWWSRTRCGWPQALRRGLRAEGFAVDVAHDGEAGLHLAREGAYDAVVLDVMLPGLSGYRVCQQLRAAQNWTPVLMLSAKDGEYDQADGLDLGADDYLTKPFSFVVLLARLRALLRRGAPSPAGACSSAGDLVLDPAARTCTRGGTPVVADAARVRAARVPACAAAARSVTKRELLEHVWDAHYDGDPNVVEVYVGYLRRKIDQPFGRHGRSRPCAAWATGWPPTVADDRRDSGRRALGSAPG